MYSCLVSLNGSFWNSQNISHLLLRQSDLRVGLHHRELFTPDRLLGRGGGLAPPPFFRGPFSRRPFF